MPMMNESRGETSPEVSTESRGVLWDWPTRLFHWAFAGLFTVAFSLSIMASEHGLGFLLHMILGLILIGAVLLRLVWGLLGSKPSRFSAFLFSPMALFRYGKAVIQGKDQPHFGHNPGSSYAAYAMLLLALGLGATGVALGQGQKGMEELHKVFAYSLVGVVVLHILGLALYTLRHRENIAMSMVHGQRAMPASLAIPSTHPWVGLAFLLVLGGWTALLVKGLDVPGRRVTLPGLNAPLQLGELEKEWSSPHSEGHGDDD